MLHAKLTREIRSGPRGPKVGAFFDLDQTLLAGFSAGAFFRERLVSGRMSPRELGESVLGALSFGLGRTGFSGFMAAATSAYRGTAESVLEEIGEEVFHKDLAREIYPESRALVRAHQEMGHTVAVVTSATRYQAAPFAEDLGIEHVLCSELEVEDGIFTGRVVHPTCYGEGKAEYARRLAVDCDLDLDASYFYTDSDEDLPLLEIVGHPRPLNPNNRLAQIAKERSWPVRRFHSRGTPGVGDWIRTVCAYGSVLPSAAVGIATGVLTGSRREALNVMGSMWGDLAIALAGVDLRVEGEEHLWSRRPAVFLFNHQSGLDAMVAIKLLRRDMTGVAKREIQQNPIFGPVFTVGGVAFIDRSDTKKAIDALRPAVDALRQGLSLAIFPEGTRSDSGRLGPFKKGAFHIAMQAGVPVVPVVLKNTVDALPKGAVVLRPATVEVVVLPPTDTSDWTREGLEDEIRAIRDRYQQVLQRD
jgi:putative phosphoserine phosphatase/1-acylglycerol-3-phosphate O-acyltransferase